MVIRGFSITLPASTSIMREALTLTLSAVAGTAADPNNAASIQTFTREPPCNLGASLAGDAPCCRARLSPRDQGLWIDSKPFIGIPQGFIGIARNGRFDFARIVQTISAHVFDQRADVRCISTRRAKLLLRVVPRLAKVGRRHSAALGNSRGWNNCQKCNDQGLHPLNLGGKS
jgi:hypothetical protein